MPVSRSTSRCLAIASVLMCGVLLGSCGTPFKKLRGDRAFIRYWPPPAGNGSLRLAVKDNIDVAGVVTTAGSEYFHKTGRPAKQDALCLAGARARGVPIVGKTNLTELALGASGLNDYFGTPKNHLGDTHRLMPGGSSSGSAVAVADGRADVAFGTDTAGSIRTPAACCGIYGLKTTFGLVPLKGVFPVSPKHLDTVGPMAADVPKLVEGMDLLKPGTKAQYMEAMAEQPGGGGIRVGRLYVEGTDPEIDRALDDALQRAGFKVVRLGRSFADAWRQARKYGQVVAVADGYESDRHLLKVREVTGTTKAALLLGDLRDDTKTYEEALRWKPVWERQLRRVFESVDFIALPTLSSVPLKIPLWGRFAVFEARVLGIQNTIPVNYAGNPAIAIPIPLGGDSKVPVTSLQLVGRKQSEAKLLNAARLLASNN